VSGQDVARSEPRPRYSRHVRFLRRSTPSTAGAEAGGQDDRASVSAQEPGRTLGKGRATPKRREAQRSRGPAPPPPRTQREATKIAKAARPSRAERRRQAAEQRERLNAGDDRYLAARDRGPVRAHIRDLVDSRRHLAGVFMPLALVAFGSLLVPYPRIQALITLATVSIMAGIVVEALVVGAMITARVRTRFPKEQVRFGGVAWYAFSRASQPRRLRLPKPRVAPGAPV